MKKNKLSNVPSQNTSPVPYRKSLNDENDDGPNVFASDPDITKTNRILPEFLTKSLYSSPGKANHINNDNLKSTTVIIDNNYETINKRHGRTHSYDSKDPGYETIPDHKKSIIKLNKININNNNNSSSSVSGSGSGGDGIGGIDIHKARFSAPPGTIGHI